MRYELRIPPTADGALAVKIGRWLKQPGDPVKAGEDLVEGMTEKITLYVSAPAAGTLAEIVTPSGTIANVGDLVGYVEGG